MSSVKCDSVLILYKPSSAKQVGTATPDVIYSVIQSAASAAVSACQSLTSHSLFSDRDKKSTHLLFLSELHSSPCSSDYAGFTKYTVLEP